jgi:hypothetical protein
MFSLDQAESVDPHIEAAYRRGYVQAVAELALLLKASSCEPSEIAQKFHDWANFKGDGDVWRKDLPLNKKIMPPLPLF